MHLFPQADFNVDWIVDLQNKDILPHHRLNTIFTAPEQIPIETHYNLVICLEDDFECISSIFKRISYLNIFGTYPKNNKVAYTESSAKWFDMGLTSKYDEKFATELKKRNRESYQELLFNGLSHVFNKQSYILPENIEVSSLKGDIAIAPIASNKWPSKNWAFYSEFIEKIANDSEIKISILPLRKSLLHHIADIKQHSLLISGDSLPMHIAIGLGIKTLTIFTCTSPWEIYNYGNQIKIISPLLEQYFYTREYIPELVKSISSDLVLDHYRKLNA